MSETISFGNKLRLARERRGLSQEEAAKSLCLNTEIINALENEQFDKLPSAVFVRGYIKNYANLLRLTINEQPARSTSTSTSSTPPETTSREKSTANHFSLLSFFSVKSINYIVVLVLTALVFIWWYEQRHAIEKTDSTRSIINMSVEKIPFQRAKPTVPLLPLQLKQDLMKDVFPGWPL